MADQAEEKFALSLKGDGISIEKEVDKSTAMSIVATVWGGSSVSATEPAAQFSSTKVANRSVSLREFLTEVSPNTNNERIVTIGRYLHEFKSKETFSKSDIEAGFRSAREQMPKNLARDLGRTAQAGWIDESDEKGQFHVTNTGAKAVENCFGRQRQAAV